MDAERAEIDALEAGMISAGDEAASSIHVRHAAMITAAMGIVHSVLLLLAYWLIASRAPKLDASDSEYIAFYQDPDQRRIILLAGLYLIPFAGIAFIWFTVSLRMWLTGSVRRLTPLLSNLLLVCGIIYVGLLFCAGAAMSVSAATSEFASGDVEPAVARLFPQYGTAILLVFAMRMAAMTVFAMSNIGRTSGILPKWFSYLGYLLGAALLLTASLSSYLVVLFPAWVFLFCVILIDKARRIPKSLELERAASERRGTSIGA
jgi:hypothetical protein